MLVLISAAKPVCFATSKSNAWIHGSSALPVGGFNDDHGVLRYGTETQSSVGPPDINHDLP